MTPLESALTKSLRIAREYIESGRVNTALEVITTTLNEVDQLNKPTTTGEPQ